MFSSTPATNLPKPSNAHHSLIARPTVAKTVRAKNAAGKARAQGDIVIGTDAIHTLRPAPTTLSELGSSYDATIREAMENPAEIRAKLPGHCGLNHGDPLKGRLGNKIYRADIAQSAQKTGLLTSRSGPIGQAQRAAAEAYGAQDCFFVTTGCTGANQYALLAAMKAVTTGGTDAPVVALSRGAHRSFPGVLANRQAGTHWIPVEYSNEGLSLPPTPEQLDHALTERPDIRVVAVNSHTVMGACADLKALKAVALRHGDTPLVVDGAWAGGRISYIRKLLADGAAVVTTSYHKRLPVLTQNGAVYVPAGSPISADDIEQRLSELHTTSPSSLLLSSTVAGVHGEIHSGEKRFAKLAQRVDRMRSALNKIDGIHVLGRTISLGEGSSRRDFELDPTNLVLKIDGYADGADVRAQLHKHHVSILGTDGDYVNFALPAGLSQKMEAELLTRIRLVAQEAPRAPHGVAAEPVPAAPQRMSIYDAAQARHEFVPLTAAAGRIAGDLASVIPPGSTTIAPGEEITAEMSGYLQRLLAAGVEVSGIKSGGLIRVVA